MELNFSFFTFSFSFNLFGTRCNEGRVSSGEGRVKKHGLLRDVITKVMQRIADIPDILTASAFSIPKESSK